MHVEDRSCVCTGVRWCARCRDPELRRLRGMHPPMVLPDYLAAKPSAGFVAGDCPEFSGLWVVPEIVSQSEAGRLLETIGGAPFSPAQSGKLKQHYGPKFNFNAKKVRTESFSGLPSYAVELEARLRKRVGQEALGSYETTDLFVLRYDRAEQANLDFHVDDTFAYGEVIVGLSLESDSVLTFLSETELSKLRDAEHCVRVPIPARSAVVISGRARYEWSHGIVWYDIEGRRTSITMRTVSEALSRTAEGRSILEISRRPGLGSGLGSGS